MSTSNKYVVVGLGMSTCTRRVLTALEEKGAAYEIRPVNFGAGEHKSAEYLEVYNYSSFVCFDGMDG